MRSRDMVLGEALLPAFVATMRSYRHARHEQCSSTMPRHTDGLTQHRCPFDIATPCRAPNQMIFLLFAVQLYTLMMGG